MNSKLELVLKGYIPEVANTDDLHILKKLGALIKKLKSVNCEVFREAEKKKDQKKITTKMKEIQLEEQQLIYQITRRNLDF